MLTNQIFRCCIRWIIAFRQTAVVRSSITHTQSDRDSYHFAIVGSSSSRHTCHHPTASTTKHQKALRSHVPTSIFWFPIQFQNHTDAQDTFFIFPYRRTWTVFFCSALVLLMLLDGTHQHQAISLSLRCGGLGLCPISHFHAHFAWAANLPAATGPMLIFFLSLSSCSWLMMIWLLNASVDTQNKTIHRALTDSHAINGKTTLSAQCRKEIYERCRGEPWTDTQKK